VLHVITRREAALNCFEVIKITTPFFKSEHRYNSNRKLLMPWEHNLNDSMNRVS
jgi:hypothetical protein